MSALQPFLNPETWNTPSSPHKDAWLKYGGFYGHRWANDGSVSPLDLYCYLRARFGVPNGPTMAIRHPSTENIYQWHYVVACGDRVIHFIARIDRLEIVPQADADASADEWAELVSSLKKDFARVGSQIGNVRKSLETWHLFVNPFCRLSGILTHFERKLRDDPPAPPPAIPATADAAGIAAFQSSFDEFASNMLETRAAGLSTRMLAPVWGESFVNLVLFVLGKPEIRADRRVYESTLRQPIDVRIASLHHNCRGFDRRVDRGAGAFKKFHTLMNARNNLLHGNVDPSALRFDTVFFDQVQYQTDGPRHEIPLFDDEQNLALRLLKGTSQDISADQALADIATVREFIALVLNNIEPRIRDVLQAVMESPYPGQRQGDQRTGVLFSPMIPLSIIAGE